MQIFIFKPASCWVMEMTCLKIQHKWAFAFMTFMTFMTFKTFMTFMTSRTSRTFMAFMLILNLLGLLTWTSKQHRGCRCWSNRRTHIVTWEKPMSGCAARLEKSKQPLRHSATQSLCQGGWGQPLSHSATLAGWLEQPLSHSVTQTGWVAEWLSGWVAGPVTLTTPAEWLSGCRSHPGRASQWMNS